MQIFGKIIDFLTSRPAAITVLFFYALDHLFGNVAFDCPCTLPKELRIHFAWVLLVCPALIIICIDIPWNLLSNIIKARCCRCQEACGGAFMAVVPPLGFSIAWIFIFQESEQFSACINAMNTLNQTECIEDYNSTEYKIRKSSVVLLCLMTSALGLRAAIQFFAPCCISLCNCSCEFLSEPCCISWLISFCKSRCDCLTIHPNSGLLNENLSFSTFHELQREHFLIEDEFFKGYPVERTDKLNIGEGQQIRLKNYFNSPRTLKARNTGKGCTLLTWIAPNDFKGQDSGYIIQYKIKDSKQSPKQKNEQRERTTAKLCGLESNVQYSIQLWVIKTCQCKKENIFDEICTTKSKELADPTSTEGEGQRAADSKVSKIEVGLDFVSLHWSLGLEDQRKCIGYKLKYKIVTKQSHVDLQQSKTEMSAEFSNLQDDVLYRFKIWAYKEKTKRIISSIDIFGGGSLTTTGAEGQSTEGGSLTTTRAEGQSTEV